jgi:hydrogenase maturation protease
VSAAITPTPPPPSRLIIGIGNPSRGDDAIGPVCIARLSALLSTQLSEHPSALNLPDVELLTDFQLQVEYALDLAGRDEVIFIDADVDGAAPFEFRSLTPNPSVENSHTSHVLSPEAVLATCVRIGATPPSRAYVLAIRGIAFELGEGLSPQAESNLNAALAFLQRHLLARPTPG